MARRVQPVSTYLGAAVAALLILLTLGTLGAVAWRAEGLSGLRASDWLAVRFTVLQAFLSALISVLLAIPVARALARRAFWGRGALITLLGAPFILPVIVAVLGLLAVFGRNGLINIPLSWAGIEPVSIFGLPGVLLAHVFFNLPLATRLILQGWLSIPGERYRLASSLGFTSRDVFWHLEVPLLRAIVPGAFMVIFLICTTSFAVALALGGGPRATTIELAIYQAFRFDFDLSKAALLALIQFGICALAAVLSLWVAVPSGQGAGLGRVVPHPGGSWAVDTGVLIAASAFLLLPLGMIILKGVATIAGLPDSTYWAALRSVMVAVISAGLTIALALPLALAARNLRSTLVEGVGYLSIAASPLVIGTGLFIMVYRWADPVALALPILVLVNAAMSLPFALRAIAPVLGEIEADYGKLADSLGLSGWARLRIVILPRLRRPMGFAAGLAAALSMGDLGVIALFADPENQTLPLALYQLMGAYRMEDAFGAALLLLILSLSLFWLFDRGGRAHVDA
jgi:thiamine transport system permease protein